jgi:hypothetical protein
VAAEATSVSAATAGRTRERTVESAVAAASRRVNTRFFFLASAPESVLGALAQREGWTLLGFGRLRRMRESGEAVVEVEGAMAAGSFLALALGLSARLKQRAPRQ